MDINGENVTGFALSGLLMLIAAPFALLWNLSKAKEKKEKERQEQKKIKELQKRLSELEQRSTKSNKS